MKGPETASSVFFFFLLFIFIFYFLFFFEWRERERGKVSPGGSMAFKKTQAFLTLPATELEN